MTKSESIAFAQNNDDPKVSQMLRNTQSMSVSGNDDHINMLPESEEEMTIFW